MSSMETEELFCTRKHLLPMLFWMLTLPSTTSDNKGRERLVRRTKMFSVKIRSRWKPEEVGSYRRQEWQKEKLTHQTA